MTATTLQIAMMAIVLVCLLWLATRQAGASARADPRAAISWSADAVYNIGDSGEHHGSVGHHALSDFSGSSSEGASAGDAAGADGGGGGSSD